MIIRITNYCTGCGACSAINPDIFEIKNNRANVNQFRVEFNEDDCIDAALSCPADAIRIDEY